MNNPFKKTKKEIQNEPPPINLRWFIFIVIFLGQLGPALSTFNSWWDGKSVFSEILNQASQGNFLLFTTALLASSSYFIIKEYINGSEIKNRHRKSRHLLYAAILGIISSIIAFKLIQKQCFHGIFQFIFHWTIYILSIALSIKLWSIEIEESGAQEMRKLEKGADSITDLAAKNTNTSSGLKI